MNTESIPTKRQWGEIALDDLDINAAYKDFFGKSINEMNIQYYRCVIEMAYSLSLLPTEPFRYYMKGFTNFVSSELFHKMNAADTASVFLNLVQDKLENKPKDIAPLMEDISAVVENIANKQSCYDADIDIYGDFREKAGTIKAIWSMHRCS